VLPVTPSTGTPTDTITEWLKCERQHGERQLRQFDPSFGEQDYSVSSTAAVLQETQGIGVNCSKQAITTATLSTNFKDYSSE